ncbi:sterile alpha motif domain-containing protein 9-like [Plectropomus leopardus]|uniref:sterile alpha motif domain-containing protein 9-like n=1 Tax=Plectropomus leopardus TaxID=160734 RepID=UPI001C4AAFD0|nr:sterile alpha motif domain-containing protein 9-like [Plectropomus leopardus]
MANGPALSTARSGEIYAGSEIIDSFSRLDVLYANQFEGSSFCPEHINQTEENFYRGAPPEWLNFHISEQAEADGTGTPFVKRDGYDRLVKEICQRRKLPHISTVSLFHQSGCGGTTLAMKVLWDLRKTFRSAVLRGPTTNVAKIAEEVVHLFTAGSRGHQNTVLLLVDDEQILERESLQENIMTKIAEQEIVTFMPVVILLNCIRRDEFLQRDQVFLQDKLSDTEVQNFNEKKEELRRRFGDKCNQFHGFNIMQNNFSHVYVKQTCNEFSTVRRSNRLKKTQLAAFLSLLNAYVPGSYLLESQCLDFFQHDDYIHGDFSLKDRMEPFSHLIITFKQDGSEKKVRMAHSLIAKCCVELMAKAGVTRSDTARNLLTTLCKEDTDPFLAGFVKDLLTKRRLKPKQMETEKNPTNSSALKEEKERFSRLIIDIQNIESDDQRCASILKMAARKFDQNPFFPQALSRFYYIVLKDYKLAEMWAKRAKQRDPLNSFVADTLGQVHKNHLKNIKHPTTPRTVLQLATKAIEAFKDEERLAENELETDMKGDGTTKAPNLFNTRGLCGYLQVCNLVYDLLVSQNETWREVLTKNVSLGSVLEVLGDNKLLRFNDLIKSLRDEVERKCAFFDKYLTYSKPDVKEDDPPYITKDTSECFRKYVGDSPPKHFKQKGADLIQKLKQNLADTSAGVLSCLDRDCTETDLKEITTWWEELFQCTDSVTALANYIFAFILSGNMRAKFPSKCRHLAVFEQKMPLISENSPELHMLTLLLCWPTDSKEKCVLDLGKLILRMHCAYEHAYKIRFRSRYLCPLFFIGKGQDLNRIVHRKVLEGLLLEQNNETTQDWSNNWSNEMIFQDPKVQERLLKFEGEVQNYRVYANIDGALIELDANLRNSLWRPRQVFFYLGFTIRGPVAFAIQTKPAKNVQIPEMASSEPEQIKPELSALEDTTGGQHFVDRHRTDLIKRVSDTGAILDRLKDRGFISNKNQEAVRALKTTQEQMELILRCLTSASMRGKDALYEILKRMRSMRALINELEESEKGNKSHSGRPASALFTSPPRNSTRYYTAAEMASACSAISLSKKKTNVERVTHSTTITSGKSKRSAQRSSKDSNDWTRLDPVIDTVDEVQTYSLQSDAGRFECSVSALRWVCKEKVSFKYQFCSWEDHSERPSCIGYMPAGPLLDITVIAGKFEGPSATLDLCR